MPKAGLPTLDEHTSESALLGGRLRLLQAKDGYRAGMDAALLAAAANARPGERALEAGCGVGAALLQAAIRAPEAAFTGLERDADALALARRNIALNALDGRVDARLGDVASPFKSLDLPPFDLAFANPPFFDDPAALRGPAPARRGAWLADDGLGAWTRFLLGAVRQGGRVLIIHRADRLADILAEAAKGGGSFRVRPIHPFLDQPAKRVLVQAVKGGRAPLQLLPPLVLHDRSGAKHTAEAEAIMRGEAGLS
jgi:tRNA1(Val) A37 N6-methylase TrmN6